MNKDKPLSLLEKNVVAYHKKMLRDNTYGRDDERKITTFRGTLFGVGKDDEGETQLVPSWWKGKLLSTRDEFDNAKKEANDQGIQWPIYKTKKEAELREKYIHDTYMEPDISSGRYTKGIKIK